VGTLDYKSYTERHRPHFQPVDSILFVTYRLAGSIPKSTVREYQAKNKWLLEKLKAAEAVAENGDAAALKSWSERFEAFYREWFLKFEEILDKAASGPAWMKDERIAEIVAGTIRDLDGEAYRLDAYCVMSNHVHVVFKPNLSAEEIIESKDDRGHLVFLSDGSSLSRIMQALKGKSARECNLELSLKGQFWERESFDHVVRDGKFFSVLRYVLNNPVKAGLVSDWREWRFSYCRAELSDKLLVCRYRPLLIRLSQLSLFQLLERKPTSTTN
jgi:REP element-mobilizing transposase RayT